MRVFRSLGQLILPFRKSQSKQKGPESKRIDNTSKQPHSKNRPRRTQKFRHTTPEEKQLIGQLRSEGLTIREIADEFGRSTRTTHKMLVELGMNVANRFGDSEHPNENASHPEDASDSFGDEIIKRVMPKLSEQMDQMLSDNPELAREFALKALGIKLPKQSIDDILLKEYQESPEYRRELVEHRLNKMKLRDRTELDILAEGLVLVISVAEIMQKGNWPQVAEKMIDSGELRKTIMDALSVIRPKSTSPANPQHDAPVQQNDVPTPARIHLPQVDVALSLRKLLNDKRRSQSDATDGNDVREQEPSSAEEPVKQGEPPNELHQNGA